MKRLMESKVGASSFVRRFHLFDFLLIVVLLSVFWITINAPFDYLAQTDKDKDYLVARHIVQYKEFPLSGPWNSISGAFTHSPVSYYFLAPFVAIKDDIVFLRLVNILLQLSTIVIIYLLAKKAFGSGTAFIASLLFGASSHVLSLSSYPLVPLLAHPFINLSYLLLLFAYVKKSYPLVLGSIVVLLFAWAIHSTPILVMPLFLAVVFLILRKQGRSIVHYIGALAVFAGSFLLFYFSVLLDLYKTGFDTPSRFLTILVVSSPYEFSQNFLSNLQSFIGFFFSSNLLITTRSFGGLLFFVVLLGVPLYFFYFQKDASKKFYALLTLLGVLQLLVMISLLKAPVYSYMFIPVLGLFIIFIAEILNTILSKYHILTVFKIILVILLIKVFFMNFFFLEAQHQENRLNPIITSIKTELYEIKTQEDYNDFSFFQVRLYRKVQQLSTSDRRMWFPSADAVFWTPLEKDLNTKLTTTIGKNYQFSAYRYFGSMPIGSDDYIFLICQNQFSRISDIENECIDTFLMEHRTHSIGRQLYSRDSLSVYVMKKIPHSDTL